MWSRARIGRIGGEGGRVVEHRLCFALSFVCNVIGLAARGGVMCNGVQTCATNDIPGS